MEWLPGTSSCKCRYDALGITILIQLELTAIMNDRLDLISHLLSSVDVQLVVGIEIPSVVAAKSFNLHYSIISDIPSLDSYRLW